jgi:aminomethyltransferase
MNGTEAYETIRNAAAMVAFDGMGLFRVSGPSATALLDRLVAGSVASLREGRGMQSLIMNEAGGVETLVDLLAEREGFTLLIRPERRDVAARLLAEATGDSVELTDLTDTMRVTALIGPDAMRLAQALCGEDVIGLPFLGCEPYDELNATVYRTGTTGEYEFWFIADPEATDRLRQSLEEAGARAVDPEALDAPMLEMKTPNQRHEIGPDTTPVAAGLHWMLDFSKEATVGMAIVREEKTNPSRKLLSLTFEGEGAPKVGGELTIENQRWGRVAATAWSPTMERWMGLGYIDAELAWVGVAFGAEGEEGGLVATAVSAPAFITRSVREASL